MNNVVWNVYEIFPSQANKPIASFSTEHMPLISDVLRAMSVDKSAQTASISIINDWSRVLSFNITAAGTSVPFVYIISRTVR